MSAAEPRCQICRQPGEDCCSDGVACNFRARRRLGIPLHICLEFRARDLDALARRTREQSERLAAMPPRTMSVEYREYLASARWRAFRLDVFQEAHYRCEECGEAGWDLEVHHLTYERLGRERPEDVVVLCPPCHSIYDEVRRADAKQLKRHHWHRRRRWRPEREENR